MAGKIVTESLDGIFSASPIGSLDKALTNNIRGFNALQTANAVIPNQDHQGYLFVTRPQCNMQKDNLRNFAPIYGLLNDDPNSAGLAIRMLLDPRIGAGYNYAIGPKSAHKFIPPLQSNHVDNANAFLPFVTNNVITSTGWGDKTIGMGSTDPGLYKQTYSFVDGVSRSYEEWDLTINLQNVKGDISIALFSALMDYRSATKEELMVPYPDYLMNNRVDAHLRAYRLIVDKNKEYVTKIMAPAAMSITSVPFGMFGDFDRNTPFSEQTKEIALRFRCMAQINNDPRLIYNFNGTVRAFNPGMADNMRDKYMQLVPRRYLQRFQSLIYPRINPDSLRLEWWTYKNVYNQKMGSGSIPSYAEA